MNRLRIVLIICYALLSGNLFGQTPFFQQYYLLRKNDPVQINDILQSKNGTMWFATNKGLFSFDGKNYKHYHKQDGLPHETVTALAEDSLGRLWSGFGNGAIGHFNKNDFEAFVPEEGLPSKTISKILFDSKGILWFGTYNDGLYYYRNNRLFRVDGDEGMPDLFIYDMSEDHNGNIWVGTDGGVAICTIKEGTVGIEVLDNSTGLPDNIIRKIIPGDNSVVLATEDAGILRYNLKSKTFESLISSPWTYGPVSDVVIDNDNIWMSCPQKGLLLLNTNTKQVSVFTPEHYSQLSSIRVLAPDVEGNLWIGSKTSLLRTPGETLQFIHEPAGTRNANIQAVTVGLDGDIWFANSDGLFRRKRGSNVSQPYLAVQLKGKSPVISLYTDHLGYIWAGLYGEGVFRINPKGGKALHLSKEIANGNVLGITGETSTVWLATLGGASRILFDKEGILEIQNYSRASGLNSDFIYQVFLENGRVWFSTDGSGLGMMNRTGFHRYQEGLPNAAIYGVAQDAKRRLWANVQGHGLYIFDGKTFHPADSSLLIRDKNIHSLASDQNGNIVVMHDAGMDVIDINRNKVIYLGEETGIREKTGNLNAVNKDLHGNIYFGTTGGIIEYNANGRMLTNEPTPEIRGVSIFDVPLNISERPLKYDENNLTIEYLGIWYKNPDGIYYSYQLENYDRNWITTRNQSVTYSQLPPGSYRFRLRASESPEFRDAKETAVSFTIRPPFWQTLPFYLATATTLIAIVFLVIYSREKKLRRYNELLEEKVAMRTREIQVQNEEIQAQNEEISAQSEEIMRINENLEDMVQERTRELERKNKVLEEYAFINAHKLRSPVATILGLLNLISKTKLDDEALEINRRLQLTADELDNIVRSITKTIERADRKIPKVKDD